MSRVSPEEVLTGALDEMPDGAFLTGAVVVVTYVLPGEDEDDDRGPFLAWRCDGVAGRWAHLGMLETVAGDMRRDLSSPED